MSHNGRPNQVLIRFRCPTFPRVVPSARPAEARASTNPDSTSVSYCFSSSADTDAQCSRRSRTTASAANPSLLAFGPTVDRSDEVRTLQESLSYVTERQNTRKKAHLRSAPRLPGRLTRRGADILTWLLRASRGPLQPLRCGGRAAQSAGSRDTSKG
ncbi:hypothetical protein GCM10010207_80360 [Streptomyces atratus]|nr:hypothetical protein GCM10010207_80360 [Streptomyces atratus]